MTISFHDLSKMTRAERDKLLKRSEADSPRMRRG